MPHIRVAHRRAPVRPAVPLNRPGIHRPANPRPIPPRILPVLQPPTYMQQSEYIHEEQEYEEHQDEASDYSNIIDNDQNRKLTQQIPARLPTFHPQQNYPKQPLPHRSSQPIRYAEPKYARHIH